MRVLQRESPEYFAPAIVYSALFSNVTGSVWLDSGPDAVAGASFVGASTRIVTASVSDGTVTMNGVVAPGTILEFLRGESPNVVASGLSGFPLGWVGWLGYELRSQTMGTPVTQRSQYLDAALLFVDRGVSFDHWTGRMSFIALADEWDSALDAWLDSTLEIIRAFVPVLVPVSPPTPARASWKYSDAEYLRMIAECQGRIAEGDAYQLCLTSEASVDIRPNPLATYLALRESSPSHHGALIRIGDVSLLSSSPEQFLTVSSDGIVESRPIKGTRPRGENAESDARLRAELLASEKERAENLMIVDLMRNDIARVSAVGTVEVTSLLEVESYAQVHQLVSTVRGRLAPGLTAVDAVESCFPAGSMTGAPKQRATEILDRLENRARGIYSGVFGYFGVDGSVDLAMVIRSIVLDAKVATVGSGGGITALSVPAEELAEVRLKAAALLAVLGAST
jgi:para-aminobenzoate synthetase component I